MSEQKFYCPKCGKKKLVSAYGYVGDGYHRYWRCEHNMEPKSWRGRRDWDKEKNPPCGLEIKVPGRNAEIDDYGTVIDKMANIAVPQIQQWLLKHDSDVRKKGIEVLYEGEFLDLVRRTDAGHGGLGVAIYWRAATWDRDPDIHNPTAIENDALRAESSQHITFRGFNVAYLFDGHSVIWQKGEDQHDAVFKGKTLGKKLKAKLVSFAQAVEANYEKLLAKAKSESARWVEEKKAFKHAIEQVALADGRGRFPVRVDHYCGETQTAKVRLDMVTAEQAIQVKKILGVDIQLEMSFGNLHKRVSPETAVRLSALLKEDPKVKDIRFNIEEFVYGGWRSDTRRVTLDEALALSKVFVKPRVGSV